MKICTKCKENKPLAEYHKFKRGKNGRTSRCKVCFKIYYQNNADKILARRKKDYHCNFDKYSKRAKKYRKKYADKRRAYNKEYQEHNRDKIRAQKKIYMQRPEVKERYNKRQRQRRGCDVNFRLRQNLSQRLYYALKGKTKSKKTLELLGCSVEQLKRHLEKQFKPGMTWENKGKWDVDHILPCASFDLSDPYQQKQCFHYSNLQPLWSSDNRSKGDKELYNKTWIGTQWVNSHKSALTTVRSFTSLPSSGIV